MTADAWSGIETWIDGAGGLTFLRGHARLTNPTTVEVGGETLSAPRIFLNVGGRATVRQLMPEDWRRIPFNTFRVNYSGDDAAIPTIGTTARATSSSRPSVMKRE